MSHERGDEETGSGWLSESRLAGLSSNTTAASVLSSSWLGRLVQVTPQWVRDSWLYWWLTAEPDPTVIVIDFRETYAVRPFLRVLDGVIEHTRSLWEASSFRDVVVGVRGWLERLGETRTGTVVRTVFGPPDRPDDGSRADVTTDRDREVSGSETDNDSDTDRTSTRVSE